MFEFDPRWWLWLGGLLLGCDATTDEQRFAQKTAEDAAASCEPRGDNDPCNGLDDDCDGLVDEDPDLLWWVDADGDGFGAGEAEAACAAPGAHHVQTDGDCDDHNPFRSPALREADACSDGLDSDCDGLMDCEDPDCASTAACVEDREESCEDEEDNDLDGLTDCEDPDCLDSDACDEDCEDGVDNDLDGLIDCEDSDCIGPDCAEDCTDAIDNDADGLTDCEDDDCWGHSSCPARLRAQLTAGSGHYGRLLTTDKWPADKVYWLKVDSATGWVSTWNATDSWRACNWAVDPWSGYLTGSLGVYMRRGISSGRFHIEGSCSATASQMPNLGFSAIGSNPHQIFAYPGSDSVSRVLWYDIPIPTTTTLDYTPSVYRVLQAPFVLGPSETWERW